MTNDEIADHLDAMHKALGGLVDDVAPGQPGPGQTKGYEFYTAGGEKIESLDKLADAIRANSGSR